MSIENYHTLEAIDENPDEMRQSYCKKFSLNELFEVGQSNGSLPLEYKKAESKSQTRKSKDSNEQKIVNIKTRS